MATARNIYLTGFSGTGKSTVGQLLSARLGMPLRDLDDAIVAGAGMAIPAIFAAEGEEGFRRHERAALRAVAGAGGAIVSTGGGLVVDPANRALLRESGWIVCLEATPETVVARVTAHLRADEARAARPMLDAPDPLARVRDLKAARQSAYADAHWTVHTDGLTPGQVAEEIARAVAVLEGARGAVPAVETCFRFGRKWFGRNRPLVCVPIVARTADEAVEQAERFAALAPDALELRADWLPGLTPEGAVALLARIAALTLPVIFTNRAEREGGARPQDEAARLAILTAAIESRLPALVDVELATEASARDRLLTAAKRHGVPVMLSFHDFAGTPDDDTLIGILREMERAGAGAAKIAVLARDEDDAIRLLGVCRRSAPDVRAEGRGRRAEEGRAQSAERGAESDPPSALRIPVAAMAMGPAGAITRVLGHRAGSALTFAAASAERGSAPGQLTIAQLRACWATIGDEG